MTARRHKQVDPIPSAEWATALVGLLLVMATLGFLVYQAVFTTGPSIDIVVRIDRITPTSSGHLVVFEAENRGRDTAADLRVEGAIRGHSGAVLETSEATLDYLPGGSRRRGGMFFARDPRGSLELSARGFQSP